MTTVKRIFQVLTLALISLIANTSGAVPPYKETSQLFFGPQKTIRAQQKQSLVKKLMATPYNKVLMSLAATGAFAISKMASNAWKSNQEKSGSERLRGFLSDIKLGELLAKARNSAMFQSAASSLLTDAIMHSASRGLSFLANA